MTKSDFSKIFEVPEEFIETLNLDEDTNEVQCAEAFKDKIVSIQADCDSLLHPEMGFSTIIEHSFLSDSDKVDLFSIFKEFSMMIRQYRLAKLNNNYRQWFKSSYALWKEKKPSIEKIYKKLLSNWEQEKADKLMLEYLG